MPEIRYDGRVAVVTGAGNGMGRDYALTLASRGAKVVVNDLGVTDSGVGGGSDPQAADGVVEEIIAAGGEAVAAFADVSTREGGQSIVKTAVDAFGTVDILIHNAGIVPTALFPELSEKDLTATVGVHLLGGFYVGQPCFEIMQEKRYGRIVMIASGAVFGRIGIPSYTAAKAGLIGLMHVLAAEGAPYGILSNAVMPGALTRMMSARSGAAKDFDAPPDEDDPGVAAALEQARRDAAAVEVFKPYMDPAFVTPMTLYLSSEQCQVNQGIFSAMGGRYAKAFLGLTPGWHVPGENPPSIEDIAEHLDQIQEVEGYTNPLSVSDELELIAAGRRELQGG